MLTTLILKEVFLPILGILTFISSWTKRIVSLVFDFICWEFSEYIILPINSSFENSFNNYIIIFNKPYALKV